MTWAIGNGESRTKIDVNNLKGIKVGCNAIVRDFTVDIVVCVDRRMVTEAIEGNFKNKILTRHEWIDRFSADNVHTVSDLPYKGDQRADEPFQWGSGPYAVLEAALLSKKVKMLGFDLYSDTQTINNIYKDTNNYDPATKSPIDPRYWIHQIGKVFESFPRKHFIIYQKEGWKLPKAWKHPNVLLDNISKIV